MYFNYKIIEDSKLVDIVTEIRNRGFNCSPTVKEDIHFHGCIDITKPTASIVDHILSDGDIKMNYDHSKNTILVTVGNIQGIGGQDTTVCLSRMEML